MQTKGWYALIIPKLFINIDSYEKLQKITDYSIMVLKVYMDKFYRYQKEKWEEPLLEYEEITDKDENFVEKYKISYVDRYKGDRVADELGEFVQEVTKLINDDSCIKDYNFNLVESELNNRFSAFDYANHLYAPLICLKKSGLKIQVSPVSLNSDEKLFVDLLKKYTDDNEDMFKKNSIYLLRNKSRAGMGFFEAGNFYPDYILWIDTLKKQYISFIDPKGLLRVKENDPKVEFYKTIKKLEAQLKDTYTEKEVILNSFIMSGTKYVDLKQWWSMNKLELEARNVLFLEDDNCIKIMIEKIFN